MINQSQFLHLTGLSDELMSKCQPVNAEDTYDQGSNCGDSDQSNEHTIIRKFLLSNYIIALDTIEEDLDLDTNEEAESAEMERKLAKAK